MTDLIHHIAHPPEVLAWANAQHARIVGCLESRDAAHRGAGDDRAPARHRARARGPAAAGLDFRPPAPYARALEVGGSDLFFERASAHEHDGRVRRHADATTSGGSPSSATSRTSAGLELVLQLRDLVHDHLGPRRLLHDLRPGVEQRRPDRHLVGLADHLRADPAGRVLDVRARVEVPDRGRHLLLGVLRSAARAGAGSPAGSTSSAWSASSPRSTTRAATFLNASLSLYGVNVGVMDFSDGSSRSSARRSSLFVLILGAHALINIFSSPLVALFNNISVGWHVFGVAVIVAILVFVPDKHQSVDFVFTDTINNSGFSQSMFWFYVLPLGFLLTMYTQTGYDASAHLSEETRGRGARRRQGRLAAGLLVRRRRLDRAAGDHVRRHRRRSDQRRPRLVARGVRQLADAGREQGRRGDRDDRPAVLRHGVRDELLADDVRVLARPRGARLSCVDAAQPPPRAGLRRPRVVRRGADHHAAGARGRRERVPVRVLRRRLDHA